MKFSRKLFLPMLALMTGLLQIQCNSDDNDLVDLPVDDELIIPPPVETNLDPQLVEEGKDVFRYGTFADESFWSGTLELDKAILGEANGGFGPGVSPNTALALGINVDAEALPQEVVDAISGGEIDLDDPMTTVALLKLNAVVGVIGTFDDSENLISVGISCSACHSTVDNSFSQGIGSRMDGWPNRNIDVGAVIAAANTEPLADLLGVDDATAKSVLNSWGPGRFDGALLLDGRPVAEDGSLIPAALVPAIFGLSGVNPVSYTGYGDLELWARFVAVVELGGQGNFSDPRLNDADRFPIAVATNAFNRTVDEDVVDPVLPALLEYIESLTPPKPNEDSFDEASAIRGMALFEGQAQCATCHTAPLFADNVLHTPEEMGIDDIEADRFPSGMYRTTPLRALFTKSIGGYYHDGRFSNLEEVIEHYNNQFDLNLTAEDKADLEQYLNAL